MNTKRSHKESMIASLHTFASVIRMKYFMDPAGWGNTPGNSKLETLIQMEGIDDVRAFLLLGGRSRTLKSCTGRCVAWLILVAKRTPATPPILGSREALDGRD